MPELLSAGKNVESWCTKCRLVLDHTIVAMEGGEIARVKCNTCGSRHKFRDPATAGKARAAGGRKADRALPSAATVWAAALGEAKGEERVYDMTAQYRIGDIVVHPVFGKGVVQKLYANKCDMLFEDKARLMATGN